MDPFAGGKSVVNTDCQPETNFVANVKSFIITTKQTCAFGIKICYLSFCAIHGVIDWRVIGVCVCVRVSHLVVSDSL